MDSPNLQWVPQGDGTFELQFLVRTYEIILNMITHEIYHQTCDTHRLSVENIPNVKGYTTSDLFVPHPSKDLFWKMYI